MVDYRIAIEKDIVDWAVAVTPLVSLVITVYVAVLQYKLAQRNTEIDERNLKFTLYTARKKIYDAIKIALGEVMREAHFKLDSYYVFLRETRDAQFLFGKDVWDELELIRKNLVQIHSKKDKLENIPVGEERTRIVNEHSQLLEWADKEFDVISRLFAKYLKID